VVGLVGLGGHDQQSPVETQYVGNAMPSTTRKAMITIATARRESENDDITGCLL
jgi:hypothetical protein